MTFFEAEGVVVVDGWLRVDAIQAFKEKRVLLYVSERSLGKHDVPVRVTIEARRAGAEQMTLEELESV